MLIFHKIYWFWLCLLLLTLTYIFYYSVVVLLALFLFLLTEFASLIILIIPINDLYTYSCSFLWLCSSSHEKVESILLPQVGLWLALANRMKQKWQSATSRSGPWEAFGASFLSWNPATIQVMLDDAWYDPSPSLPHPRANMQWSQPRPTTSGQLPSELKMHEWVQSRVVEPGPYQHRFPPDLELVSNDKYLHFWISEWLKKVICCGAIANWIGLL